MSLLAQARNGEREGHVDGDVFVGPCAGGVGEGVTLRWVGLPRPHRGAAGGICAGERAPPTVKPPLALPPLSMLGGTAH
eukprot:7094082-Pyramimonas_sp.AAC.1